uniref:BHLH domain-containing protein n=1 Tax=Steinernema glaseri TaxID=37863 RepID=A0A1I8A146_9BILA
MQLSPHCLAQVSLPTTSGVEGFTVRGQNLALVTAAEVTATRETQYKSALCRTKKERSRRLSSERKHRELLSKLKSITALSPSLGADLIDSVQPTNHKRQQQGVAPSKLTAVGRTVDLPSEGETEILPGKSRNAQVDQGDIQPKPSPSTLAEIKATPMKTWT